MTCVDPFRTACLLYFNSTQILVIVDELSGRFMVCKEYRVQGNWHDFQDLCDLGKCLNFSEVGFPIHINWDNIISLQNSQGAYEVSSTEWDILYLGTSVEACR